VVKVEVISEPEDRKIYRVHSKHFSIAVYDANRERMLGPAPAGTSYMLGSVPLTDAWPLQEIGTLADGLTLDRTSPGLLEVLREYL
jgi:hypothetical protein